MTLCVHDALNALLPERLTTYVVQLLDTAFQRAIKKEPATATELKRNPFPDTNKLEADEMMGDPVARLWSF